MSVKKNFIYSGILTASQYFFPLITYPYISRVLGVSNIGIVNYIDSIINYFILFSMLGMAVVGIREIAMAKNGKKALSNTFWGLFILNGLTTIIALAILVICIYVVPEFEKYRMLLFIGVIKLVGNFCLIDWFYKGIENFKYITNRTILIKLIYVASVFIFIHNSEDYEKFFLLSVLTIGLNAIFNLTYVFRFVLVRNIRINVKAYLKPFISMGGYQILTSMYTSFNVAYLGWTVGTTQVGYYTTATKIYGLILALYGAFTGVMLPRMSSLLAENKMEEFKKYVVKSTNFMLILNIPVILFGLVYAPQIIDIVSGKGYEGAIIPFQLTMILMLLVGYDQIQIIQILMPMKYDKAILVNSAVGAVVGIVANILLVPYFKSIGSAMVLVISELAVLLVARYFIRKKIALSFPMVDFMKQFLFYIPLGLTFWFLKVAIESVYIPFFMSLCIVPIYVYVLHYLILKNELVVNFVNSILKR